MERVKQARLAHFIPKISEERAKRLLRTDAVFIDARLSRDYEAGHLDKATSIPVNSDDEFRLEAMSLVAKDAQVVVYCQSSRCKFAEKMAIKLIGDGFSEVSIFKGGWNQWIDGQEAKEKKP